MSIADFRRELINRAALIQLPLPAPLLDRLEAYYSLLLHWNKRINLTALTIDPPSASAVDRLFLEPLVAARALITEPNLSHWYDVGSGGGSPAIPLRLVWPGGTLTMIESRARKAAFLGEIVRKLQLERTFVEAVRFEALPQLVGTAGTASLITLRAIRVDAKLVRIANRLLSRGGLLVIIAAVEAAPVGIAELRPPAVHELVTGTSNSSLRIYRSD